MGVVPAAEGFLATFLARVIRANGGLLVADEVITGFRVAPGGGQALTGDRPDLTVMGKIIGGGLPAAAYGGPSRVHGADRPRRRRLPGRHAVGQPAGRGRGSGDPGPARRRRLRPCGRRHRATGQRPRRGRRGTPPTTWSSSPCPVSSRPSSAAQRTVRTTPRPRQTDQAGLWGLLPRAAGPRRLPARLAVRGLVPLHRPHRRRHRPHRRGGRRGSPRSDELLRRLPASRYASLLADIADRRAPALRDRGLVRPRLSICCGATSTTPRAWSSWPRWGDLRRPEFWAMPISAIAQAPGWPETPPQRDAVWEQAVQAVRTKR